MLHRLMIHLLVILTTVVAAAFGTAACAHDFWIKNLLPASDEFKKMPLWWSLLVMFLAGFYIRSQTPIKPFLSSLRTFYNSKRASARSRDLLANLAIFWSKSLSILTGLLAYEILCYYHPIHPSSRLSQHLPELTAIAVGFVLPNLCLRRSFLATPPRVLLDNPQDNPICLFAKGEEVFKPVKDVTGAKVLIENTLLPLYLVDATTSIPSVALIGQRGAGKSLSAKHLKYLLHKHSVKHPNQPKIHFITSSAWETSSPESLLEGLLEQLTFILANFADTTDIALPRSLRQLLRDTDRGFIKKFFDSLSLPIDECLQRIDRRLELTNVKIVIHFLDDDRIHYSLSKVQSVFESLSKTKHISFLIEHTTGAQSPALDLERFIDHFIYLPPLKDLDLICQHSELEKLENESLKSIFQQIVTSPRRWHNLRKELYQQLELFSHEIDFETLVAAELLKQLDFDLYQFLISYGSQILSCMQAHQQLLAYGWPMNEKTTLMNDRVAEAFLKLSNKPQAQSCYLLDLLLTPQWRVVCRYHLYVKTLPSSEQGYQRLDHGDGTWFPYFEKLSKGYSEHAAQDSTYRHSHDPRAVYNLITYQGSEDIKYVGKAFSLWSYHFEKSQAKTFLPKSLAQLHHLLIENRVQISPAIVKEQQNLKSWLQSCPNPFSSARYGLSIVLARYFARGYQQDALTERDLAIYLSHSPHMGLDLLYIIHGLKTELPCFFGSSSERTNPLPLSAEFKNWYAGCFFETLEHLEESKRHHFYLTADSKIFSPLFVYQSPRAQNASGKLLGQDLNQAILYRSIDFLPAVEQAFQIEMGNRAWGEQLWGKLKENALGIGKVHLESQTLSVLESMRDINNC